MSNVCSLFFVSFCSTRFYILCVISKLEIGLENDRMECSWHIHILKAPKLCSYESIGKKIQVHPLLCFQFIIAFSFSVLPQYTRRDTVLLIDNGQFKITIVDDH